MVDEQVEEKLDLDTEQEQQGPVIIPGLDVKREEGSIGNRENDDDDDDDWDSESEDDLQIVLNNDDGHMGGMGMMDKNNNEGMGSDDEDGEDLVIVANGDHQQHTNEEQEWRDDATKGSDGEKKEAGENGKANGGVVSTGGTRIGYNNHMYHPHHSQFKQWSPEELLSVLEVLHVKFVRLSMWVLLVVVVEVIGDLQGSRFLLECRSLSTLLGPTPQLDEVLAVDLNLLPSHKTVFDIDIESFEDKPWRHPGADLDNMEQLRLEATMQSKIRVYESGRSEQDYDPDLPPELAAAAGI